MATTYLVYRSFVIQSVGRVILRAGPGTLTVRARLMLIFAHEIRLRLPANRDRREFRIFRKLRGIFVHCVDVGRRIVVQRKVVTGHGVSVGEERCAFGVC